MVQESKQRKRTLMELLNKISKGKELGDHDFDEKLQASRSRLLLHKADSMDSRIGDPDNDCAPEADHDQDKAYSWPPSPRAEERMLDPEFNRAFLLSMEEFRARAGNQFDNCYAEAVPKSRALKTGIFMSKFVQTYSSDLHGTDFQAWLYDDTELDEDLAGGLIRDVLDGLSEAGPEGRKKRKPKRLSQKRRAEIPEFDLHEIMGEFDIDDVGNLIIVKEKSKLMDRMERRVNKRGYLLDRHGNVVNQAR